jgi:hypothetical protein
MAGIAHKMDVISPANMSSPFSPKIIAGGAVNGSTIAKCFQKNPLAKDVLGWVA